MLKNKLNISMLFIVVLFIISSANITALAAELPDLSTKGTIKITMKKGGNPVPGGEFEIYHIANVSESNGALQYTFTTDFKNCTLPLNNIESDKFSSDLERYINSNKISGIKMNVGNNGIAEFSNLDAGLYFIMQNETANGYNKANSFTVSLPAYENGKYNYTVNATPKFSFSDTSDTENTTQPTTVKPQKPTDANLPKTGQLNLPVPILLTTGICMLVLGLVIRFSGRKEKNEE